MNNICENCGCSHDGSYGSGRFCSKRCRMSYISQQNSNRYIPHNTGRTCFKAKGGWICNHCGIEFRTKRDKEQHVREIHYGCDSKLTHAWNYGLTKQTSPIIAAAAQKKSDDIKSGKRSAPGLLFEWTDERRQQQSERKKQLYQAHPEKHPNRKCAGNRHKMTYPEQVTYDLLIAYGYTVIHNYHYVTDAFNRYIDFYVPALHLFIEVDGERWHRDSNVDAAKDDDANLHGYITLRIKPKLGICNQVNAFFEETRY